MIPPPHRLLAPASRAPALLVSLLLVAGCATKRDVRDLQGEIRALSARQDSILRELQAQNRLTQDTLRQQTQQLFQVRGDLSFQLQQIMDELARIRELSGQNQRAVASLRDQIAGLRQSAVQAPPSVAAPGGALPGVPGQMGAPGAAQAEYDQAVSLFNRGSLNTARIAFGEFVRTYPGHALAPRAQFYLADILAQEDRAEEAIRAFDQIPALYPTSETVPDALYRAGLLHLEAGRRDEARRYLQRVVNTYPDSSVAPLAREQLAQLGR